jgi:hypothetical protein
MGTLIRRQRLVRSRADAVVPPETFEKQRTDDAATKIAVIRTKAPLALNFPVLVMQLPYILVSPAKRERVPKECLPTLGEP